MVGDILQPTHLLFVLVIALLVLGPKRLPEVGRAIGDGLRDFRSAINGEGPSHHSELNHEHDLQDDEDKHDLVADTPPQATDHEFAADIPATAEDHQFAHEEAAASVPTGRIPVTAAPAAEQATEPATEPAGEAQTDVAGTSDEKHEFAYESSDPAPPRDEPHN